MNSINNSNGTVLQKLLTVIDDANVFILFFFSCSLFYLETRFYVLSVNQCF